MDSRFLKLLKRISIIIFSVSAVLYPALVYYFLVIRNIPLRHFSLFIIAFALIAFIVGTSRKKSFFYGSLVLLSVGVLCLITDFALILKFYPLLMNILFLVTFGSTFFISPNMIFRFAAMQDKSIKGSLGEKKIEAYCFKVTIIWCVFFIVNGSIAAWTIFSGSDVLWSVYNGGISYLLIGSLFAGEFIVRKTVQKNIPKAVPLSAFKANSRRMTDIVCYEGFYDEMKFKTWGDFLEGTAKLRLQIEKIDSKKWLLYCDDLWLFFLAFTALLQCKKEIMLSANISLGYIDEIRDNAPLLTDYAFTENDIPQNTFFISSLLGEDSQTDIRKNIPAINRDDTSIVMYTSGSTGKPKEVRQRLTEFENDNMFALSKWGDEIVKRKFCSTVSQHHIYGLLFSLLLPFTAGVPFRRSKIDFPEELEKFNVPVRKLANKRNDTQYMLITVPAFLKRAVEIKQHDKLCLHSPWIFSSGGVLDTETAQKTKDVFGFFPIEVYGSTETSGIAWRQSCAGPEWTPFNDARLCLNRDGCLVIRSPYIKDSAGFETADTAEILDDGRFLLKGRIDSVVKIEEKRISVTEVENRILQSDLVSDVCVIGLHDKRQYLAAAVVFNDKGKERFLGLKKNEINNYWKKYLTRYFDNIVIPKKWRYLQTIPADLQGKKKKDEIKLLFYKETPEQTMGFNSIGKETVIDKNENSVTLEVNIPPSCLYFDGHFPEFPILPAVAQIELVARFSSRYLGTSVRLSQIKRVKFSSIIKPDTSLLLKLERKDKTISFKIYSQKNDTVYSVGTVSQEDM